MQAIHLLFLLFAFCVIWSDPDYVPWPAHLSKGAEFWKTGDNWETTVMFCIFAAQFCSAAMTFSFGGNFRAPIWKNWGLVLSWSASMIVVGLLLLSGPNSLTRVFHIASEDFNGCGTKQPIWKEYQRLGGAPSPGMSFATRFAIFALAVISVLTVMAWEKFVVTGNVADWIRARYPSSRPRFAL